MAMLRHGEAVMNEWLLDILSKANVIDFDISNYFSKGFYVILLILEQKSRKNHLKSLKILMNS